MSEEQRTQTEARPVPDPTVLTTEQLERTKDVILREIECSKEIVEAKLEGIKDVFDTRLEGMDKAISLVQRQADIIPSKVEVEVSHLKRLHQEKFDSISTQFQERDTRTEQTSRDSKVAVDAALQAAKEAVGEQNKSNALAIAKSEATFTKQIDQIGVLVASMGKGFDDKIDDIKGRLQAMESQKKGQGDIWGVLAAAIGIIVGICGTVFAGVSIMNHAH